MNFFEHQDQARKKTQVLVVYYSFAVAGLILMTYSFLLLCYHYGAPDHLPQEFNYWNPRFFSLTGLGVIAVVGLGSLYRISQLAAGGTKVAELMGGRRVSPDTADLNEKRLLNVVEEMSIASGVPVPPVYILDSEPTINAFAAGTTPSNSVIAVSRGALENLTRDEIQGVIGHEFSHILNGDVRLNIHILGTIAGIFLISTIGRILMSIRSRGKGNNPLPFIGVGLFIIGYLGVFFGKLIQSAISRQREFLADASSVQFTRNPLGLASALDKISGRHHIGMINGHSHEMAHMLFTAPFRSFGGFLSSHPPLEERIHRITPHLQMGQIAKDKPEFARDETSDEKSMAGKVEPKKTAQKKVEKVQLVPFALRSKFGTLNLEGLALASELLGNCPTTLVESAHTADGARAIVLGLLIDSDDELHRKGLQIIRSQLGEAMSELSKKKIFDLSQIDHESKLAMVEVALPAIRTLPVNDFRNLHETMRALIDLDHEVSLFELCVFKLVLKSVEKSKIFTGPGYSVRAIWRDALTVLRMTAWVGSDTPEGARASFAAAIGVLKDKKVSNASSGELPDEVACRPKIEEFQRSINRLGLLAPLEKERLLMACATAIGQDGFATPSETEVLRILCLSLDVPMPANSLS